MEFTGFLTQFRKPERFRSNLGSPIRTTYSASYDDKGRIRLEESGTENLYDYIQSFAESCDIHVLLKRFANGETDVLSRVQGFYADVTELPQTYADMLNRLNEGEAFFKELPVDVRAKFGHSYSEFLASIGTPEFFDAFGMSKPETPVDPVVEPDAVTEVKEEV